MLGILCFAGARPAEALITPPVTVDGPSSEIVDFGGVAMASDGSGGVVYVKSVGGVPHVFAARLFAGEWSAPMRVDWDSGFEASEPRIAAGTRGELLVVWVSPVVSVHGELRYGLFSARLASRAAGFGSSLPVDPDVGPGVGVDAAVAGTSPGKAIVAYRVITHDFVGAPPPGTEPVQLRPGDVMADVRLARLNGDRWSRLGAINRNPEASMRPPGPGNGPAVGIGNTGAAVVAWQEPDQTGAARIWLRRVFGSTPGPILEASPTSWEGRPVSEDADSFSLAVTPYTMARVAFRIASGGGALPGRLLVNTLPPSFSVDAAKLTGPELADGGASGHLSSPDIAISEDEERDSATRLAFLAGRRPRQLAGSGEDPLAALTTPSPWIGQSGATPVVTAGAAGGGIVAYPTIGEGGLAAVAVRQEFPSGGVQTGLVSGVLGGPVSDLAIGRSGGGDGLIAFRQGDAGRYQIVAERVSVPPAGFRVRVPQKWVKPPRARITWAPAASAVGGVTYAVLLDGRAVRSNLRRRSLRPGAAQLGDGVVRVRLLATDSLGGQLLTRAVKLRVDGRPPRVRLRQRGDLVVVRLRDRDSGLRGKATRIAFGDGVAARRGSRFRHQYERPGRYRVLVTARDKTGNRVVRRFLVRVP